MTLNRRERFLLFATIAIIAVGGTYLLFLPLVRSYGGQATQLATLQRELDGYRETINRRDIWQRDYDQLRAGLGQQIGSFEQMSDVLKKIEEVAATSGVVISSRKPMVENDRGNYRELPVQCRVEATTDTLVKFLYNLRTGSGFVSIEKLEIYSQPNSNVLRCDILINALAGKTERPAA
jgi:Tfp pilus assembly protein PilO